ncbi:MAG: SGNH/GDSL hydrolase family protein [Methylobacteriaceae bacterium]|nr:SGNH/GDSL hydrolase family protein [Methylobacteriaceae bacterium]
MVVRVAGAVAFGRAAVAGLIWLGAAGSVAAQGPEPGPGAPPLSPPCEAPADDISRAGPLPRTEARLRARTVLKVLAIGSSSTLGAGASSPKKSYPAQLETIIEKSFKGLDVIIVNRGVSGEAAATTAERLKAQVALEDPDIVLWQVGTNDAMSRVPVDQFAETVRDTIRWLRNKGVDVALVGLQYAPSIASDEHYLAIRAALAKVAGEENVLLVRRFEAMEYLVKAKGDEFLAGDGLRLNDLGYRCMAEHVAAAVVGSAFHKWPKLQPRP